MLKMAIDNFLLFDTCRCSLLLLKLLVSHLLPPLTPTFIKLQVFNNFHHAPKKPDFVLASHRCYKVLTKLAKLPYLGCHPSFLRVSLLVIFFPSGPSATVVQHIFHHYTIFTSSIVSLQLLSKSLIERSQSLPRSCYLLRDPTTYQKHNLRSPNSTMTTSAQNLKPNKNQHLKVSGEKQKANI